ncbi:MAG: hypothetical protein AB7D96_08700 [Arcobacteraceae bacterium]
MKDEVKSKFITNIRLQNYTDFEEYKQNLHNSEKYYILLSVFEVSLRNSIDHYFKYKISKEWIDSDILHKDTKQKIIEAKKKILQRRENKTYDKIIAELPLGFWTSLFRKSYTNLIRIKDIKHIFPNIPTREQKLINRDILDKKLNRIRKFRNRVFHYERIINKSEYTNIENDIFELLSYFDRDIYNFADELIKHPTLK